MPSEAKHPYRYIKLIATQPLDKKHRPASLPAFNLTDLDPYSLAVWADGLRPCFADFTSSSFTTCVTFGI